ncbi:MAG: uracil phosphoribosyltransferase [Bacteroidetes bacterium]|jgi:uracil phosphoribosyltransferase|nr:uracil phosphoribosyltransferase [Bacteroidota bacterium]
MLRILGDHNSIINNFLLQMRDVNLQQDRMRFRRNLERIGEIFAYEISKALTYKNYEVTTPLGVARVPVYEENIVLATLLRSGLPFQQGILNYFDQAESAFISAYRRFEEGDEFKISFGNITSPDINNKTLILSDPMLASGSSMYMAYKALLDKGKPQHTHIVSIIASEEGVNYLKKHLSTKNSTIWTVAIDNELTVKSYIVPGLGDAGDLAYGHKA